MSLPGNVVVLAGPFNGPDDPDASMQWVDITAYTRSVSQVPTVSLGRQTDLDTVDVGQFTITLNNNDHRFTPGNPTSPYYPGWRTAMRLRMVETVGFRSFLLADGNLLQPAVTIQTPDRIQTVSVTAVDRLGRLQQSRKFISTLAEYILYNGGSALKAYYPLNETGGTTFTDKLGNFKPLQVRANNSTLASQATSQASYGLGRGVVAPGDDLAGIAFTPSTVPFGNINAMAMSYWLTTLTSGLTPAAAGSPDHPLIHAGDTFTFLAWVNLDPGYQDAQNIFSAQITDASSTNVTQVTLIRDSQINTDPNPGQWVASLFNFSTGLTGTITGPIDPGGRTTLVGVQFGYSPNVFKMWLDTNEYTTVPTGSLTDPEHLTLSNVIGPIGGSVMHAQVYIGSYTRSQFLAQLDAGRTGLAGQYSGQRIRTILGYAGIASGELSQIDDGVARMSKATLAGRTPLDVLREAETTEQGLLHAYGRQLVFHSRTRRYNR